MSESSSNRVPGPFDPRAYHAQFKIGVIVACSENQVIGNAGDLPWHLPLDLKHFMQSTRGCAVIMGRKTYESLDQPLPNRLNIVLSRSMDDPGSDLVEITRDLDEAIEIAKRSGREGPIWIAGGGEIYAQSMDRVDLVVCTRIQTKIEGDTHFPVIDPDRWEKTYIRGYESDDRHAFSFEIEWWARK